MAKKSKDTGRPLTPAQLAFCRAYATHGNGAKAYGEAYPTSLKWTPKARGNQALKLLKHPGIVRESGRLAEKVQAKAEELFDVTQERVLQEMAAIGFANVGDYFTATGGGGVNFNFQALSKGQTAAIAEIVVEEFMDGKGEDARPCRRTRFKLHDKRAALKDLGQHLGMFKLPVEGELGGKGGGPISVFITNADAQL